MTKPYDTDYDITSNKHGGAPESVDAHNRIIDTKTKRQEMVLDHIKRSGTTGLTCKELAYKLNCGMNQISGRFSELKAKNLIVKVEGVRRSGSAVYVINA